MDSKILKEKGPREAIFPSDPVIIPGAIIPERFNSVSGVIIQPPPTSGPNSATNIVPSSKKSTGDKLPETPQGTSDYLFS